MRFVWLGIIAVSAVPLVYVAWLFNPLTILVLGVEWWRDRIVRLHPYRFWILFLMLVCAFSIAVYAARYA